MILDIKLPLAVRCSMGQLFDMDRVLDVCSAAFLRAGEQVVPVPNVG